MRRAFDHTFGSEDQAVDASNAWPEKEQSEMHFWFGHMFGSEDQAADAMLGQQKIMQKQL